MDLSLLIAFPAVKKILDALRYAFEGEKRQWREVGIIVASWVIGTGVVALVAASSYAADLGLVLDGAADLILAGIVVGSSAGVVADIANPTGVVVE